MAVQRGVKMFVRVFCLEGSGGGGRPTGAAVVVLQEAATATELGTLSPPPPRPKDRFHKVALICLNYGQ